MEIFPWRSDILTEYVAYLSYMLIFWLNTDLDSL